MAKKTTKSATKTTSRKPSKALLAAAAAEQAGLQVKPKRTRKALVESPVTPVMPGNHAPVETMERADGGILINSGRRAGRQVVPDDVDIDTQAPASLKEFAQSDKFIVGQKEGVIEKSQTSKLIDRQTERTLAVADRVAANWKRRKDTESHEVYTCPMCPHHKAPTDAKKSVIAKHIKTEHPRTVELMKIQKTPASRYEPKKIRINPKRTYADVLPPEMAKLLQLAHTHSKGYQNVIDRSKSMSRRSNQTSANSILTMPESMAMNRVESFDDETLVDACRLAYSRGKTNLLQKIRRIGRERGLKLPF